MTYMKTVVTFRTTIALAYIWSYVHAEYHPTIYDRTNRPLPLVAILKSLYLSPMFIYIIGL